jgi:hypothetical protein
LLVEAGLGVLYSAGLERRASGFGIFLIQIVAVVHATRNGELPTEVLSRRFTVFCSGS